METSTILLIVVWYHRGEFSRQNCETKNLENLVDDLPQQYNLSFILRTLEEPRIQPVRCVMHPYGGGLCAWQFAFPQQPPRDSFLVRFGVAMRHPLGGLLLT